MLRPTLASGFGVWRSGLAFHVRLWRFTYDFGVLRPTLAFHVEVWRFTSRFGVWCSGLVVCVHVGAVRTRVERQCERESPKLFVDRQTSERCGRRDWRRDLVGFGSKIVKNQPPQNCNMIVVTTRTRPFVGFSKKKAVSGRLFPNWQPLEWVDRPTFCVLGSTSGCEMSV